MALAPYNEDDVLQLVRVARRPLTRPPLPATLGYAQGEVGRLVTPLRDGDLVDAPELDTHLTGAKGNEQLPNLFDA